MPKPWRVNVTRSIDVATGGKPLEALASAIDALSGGKPFVFVTAVAHDDGCPCLGADVGMDGCTCEVVRLTATRVA